MTVVENKLTNIRSKLLGTKAVNKATVLEIEKILDKPIITSKIDITRLTDNESRLYYQEVLSAVDDELRNLNKVNVVTMQDVIDLGDNLISLLQKINKYLVTIQMSGYNINNDILDHKVFINDVNDLNITEFIEVKQLELMYVMSSRIDIVNDLFGESIGSKLFELEWKKGIDFELPYTQDLSMFNIFSWLLNVLHNEDKLIKHDMDFIFESNKFFNMKFKVEDFSNTFKSLEKLISLLDIVIDFFKHRFTYEYVKQYTTCDCHYFKQLEELYKMLESDQYSLGLLKLIKKTVED